MWRIKPEVIVTSLVMLVVGGCQNATCIPPATQPTGMSPSTQPTAIGQSSFSGRHIIMISGETAVPLPDGTAGPALVYIIDEERDGLSLSAFTGRNLEFFRGGIALDRVFRLPGGAGGGDNIHVAGAVTGSKYTAFISRQPQGGEVLYIVDRHGTIAAFRFDATKRMLEALDVRSVDEAFK